MRGKVILSLKTLLKVFLWAFCFVVLGATAYQLVFWNRIYKGVSVAGIDLSGKTQAQALGVLENISPKIIVLASETPKLEITLDPETKYDYRKSVESAYQIGRVGSLARKAGAKINAISQKPDLPLVFTANNSELESGVEKADSQITVPPTEPFVGIDRGIVFINKGQDGIEVQKGELAKNIVWAISYNADSKIAIPTKITKSHLSDQEVEQMRARAEKLLGKKLTAKVEFQTFTYYPTDLVSFLAPEGTKEEKINTLVEDIKNAVDRSPQDARLVFENGKVKEFAPGKDGLETNQRELKLKLQAAIETLIVGEEKTFGVEIPVAKTKPQVATGDVNNLGIKELIGRGTSLFHGSIPGRIHNVALAAGKINGLLIKPGETFSFNYALGDVSEFTGFKQAYIIKDGKTILGDGGGVCQVSTTLFRAALNTGLPILERKAHAYRVHYYEEDIKPGIDATVYDPTADLKIKNDTPANILIQTIADTKRMALTIELYGTQDGRISQISNHRIWDVVPAPPPSYQEDQSLAPGVKKQIDWAAPGTKAAFDYRVIRNGETLQERTFYSNFRPWQAVYLVGPGTTQ